MTRSRFSRLLGTPPPPEQRFRNSGRGGGTGTSATTVLGLAVLFERALPIDGKVVRTSQTYVFLRDGAVPGAGAATTAIPGLVSVWVILAPSSCAVPGTPFFLVGRRPWQRAHAADRILAC